MNTLRGCRNSETREAVDWGLHSSGLRNERPLINTQAGLGCGKEDRVPEPLHFQGVIDTSGCCGRSFRPSSRNKWEGEQEGKDAQWQWPTMSWLAHWQRKVPSRGQMGNLVRRGWSLSWFGTYPGTSSCRPGLPWTHRDDAASVSWVLALKVCATPTRQQTLSKTSWMLFFEMFSHENECSIYVCRIWNSRNL